ncbi:hypothetical protein BJV77DRAFT_963173 [Russula vinacea]|nr:hypothetical protein BJV77DRAFT_963173 [Russula vinacea]
MTTAVAASRNKILKINGHNDTISPRDRIHPQDDPKLSPQISFKCLDDTPPSSSDEGPSDMSDDESVSQEHTGNTTAPSLKERIADDFDVGDEFSKGPPRSSSWADLDLSIIVAVIAPLVNWLTGSDQLKNLFLILFLIVYLHQLVQVPWELYHAARQRQPHPSFRSLNLPEREEEATIRVQTRLAAAELQRHEFAYLFISIVTPFVGAALLRAILGLYDIVCPRSWCTAVGTPDLSFAERTASLHDTIHYPSPDTQFIAASRLQAVVDRVGSLEQELSTIKRAMAMRAFVEEMHDDLSSALQDTERAMRKQERKSESVRISYDTRFAALEKAVSRIERARGERIRGVVPSNNSMALSATDNRAYNRLKFVFGSIFRFLRTLANGLTFNYFDPPLLPASPSVPVTSMGARQPLHRTKNASRLETIEEDEMEPLATVRLDENSWSTGHAENGIPLMSRQSDLDNTGGCEKDHYHNHEVLWSPLPTSSAYLIALLLPSSLPSLLLSSDSLVDSA